MSLVATVLIATALPQGAVVVADAGSTAVRQGPAATEPDAELVRQKQALLRNYLESATAKRIDELDDATAKSLMDDARRLLLQADEAVLAGAWTEAARLLDIGIRRTSVAIARAGKRNPRRNLNASSARYEKYRSATFNLLERLKALSAESGEPAAVETATAAVEQAYAEAERLVRSGRYDEANTVMGGAYRRVAAAIASSTRGHVVVSRLQFSGPKEEYEYEQRRNEAYQLLVDMLIEDASRFPRGLRSRLPSLLAESRELVAEAKRRAAANEHPVAIAAMERSTSKLIWLLQAGGVPVGE